MVSWQTPLCPFKIEFEAEKLDEIRIAVVDAFYAVPRGGVEIGGVLYGRRTAGQLSICDYRKIETEYLTGPSFQLSEKDKINLKRLLAFTRFSDPQIWPLGMYVSHTRSGIQLSAKDLELYGEFFPEAWQVVLVLKPEQLGPVRGGYFFRWPNGEVAVGESALEFILEPHGVPKRVPDEPSTATTPESPVAVAIPLDSQAAIPAEPESTSPEHAAEPASRKTLAMVAIILAGVISAYAGYWVAAH